METSIIEKTEKARFNVMLLQIISFGIWFSGMIFIQLSIGKTITNICGVVSAFFGLLFCYAVIKNYFLSRKIKNNKELSGALCNEMYKSFDYRAWMSGLFSTITCIILIYLLDGYIQLPVKIYCMILMLIAVMTVGIHRLLLYK